MSGASTSASLERVQRHGAWWVLLVSLAACTQGGDGPAKMMWDRDTCRACSMVISDRHFAAQVRGGPKDQTVKFDDLGCAMKWLDQQPWADDPSTKIWVARQTDGEWIDGKTARYVSGRTSPMGFNFGAVDGAQDGNDFTTQRAAVRSMTARH